MFRPYPYTDPNAVNYLEIGNELCSTVSMGNQDIAKILLGSGAKVIYVDGYAGAFFEPLLLRFKELSAERKIAFFRVADAYKSSDEFEKMLKESLPEDRTVDPILLFGKSHPFTLSSLFDAAKLKSFRESIAAAKQENDIVVISGQGALALELRDLADEKVFIDTTPLNTVLRVNQRLIKPLGDAKERTLPYTWRRLYYYDYEILMEHRKELIDNGVLDFYIDGNQEQNLKMMPYSTLKAIFDLQLKSPFRATPAYIEGVWGGQFVKQLRNLPDDMRNCAWVFDMIPNEVSLQIKVGKATFNFPFSTFFKATGKQLMGEESVKRFGYIFPVRFNYDDTYGGSGNMSIQVHPPEKYNTANFGEPCSQDESYYCVKTAGSKTYLGLQDNCNVEEFFDCIAKAEHEHIPFDHDKYVNSFPSEQGDQFLLPGGTIHASGRNQVVLEIGSYTIGSYTFKLYDYLRKDLDGKPRPIHSYHGKNVLVTDRRRSEVDGVLRPKPVTVREGDKWKEEIVGEHDLIYFSLRRLSFNRNISDNTEGRFHVLVLVEGDEVLVYSKADPTKCFHQKYMEMVVVPASLGEYGIINLGKNPCVVHKTHLK